ncbi:WD g-beta repeat containing protein [Colletotrichum karsti]|uniref:WD g-beta repeat containing protein n=1 Tax=Colletotrichum karsti TaxID=1095194 RepID=A0A9P6LLE3_9PEZI|nr:WD g-beta repeat containing protein [Colletotrichum karsti]KAF9877663.1 WD g-beta repeat containing protein [Colletotrichum karsti]
MRASSIFNLSSHLEIDDAILPTTLPSTTPRKTPREDFVDTLIGSPYRFAPITPPTAAPRGMVTKEFLDSDRVNFLIWRYMLESNYRETAVKLQKEWHCPQPHRQFDFANHVKSHALVSIINKGLLYQALEREHAKKLVPQDATATAEALQVGLFGPLIPQPPHKIEEDEDADGEVDDTEMEVENTRKRQLDSRPQQHLVNGGSPSKRPRLSNGYESTNGADAATDPMDLDSHGDNHAYPSPLEGEQAPTPTPRTDGPEQGTQVDKVQELTTETTFLRLMSDDTTTNSQDGDATTMPATGTASPSPANGENAPILLRCEWNPKDPSILAAAGTDALARIWTISRSSTMTPVSAPDADGHVHGVHRPYHNLIDDETPKSATVGQLAWNWGGTAIAVAAEYAVHIWAKDGSHVDKFDVSDPPVIKLRWSPSDAALLAIAPDNSNGNGNGGALVTVYHSLTSNTMSYFLPNHDLLNWPLDAAWTSETEFLLTGGDVMMSLRCTETAILPNKKFESREDDTFTQVAYDWRSKLIATSSDKGILDLWDENGQRRSITAHTGAITALQWQPLQGDSNPHEDERLIATGGDDCAILIWNAKYPDQKAKSYLTMESPIVAVAFTPDGAFIAGATAGHILIWKVGEHTMPRASWSRAPHPGWLSPKANSEPEEEDEHCLCWDADGQRLAYGANSRLAVINFSR